MLGKMKLRLWILLISLLLPTSAFANICESRLKNKSAKYLRTVNKVYIAYGTHKPTKKTIWHDCYYDVTAGYGSGAKLNCLGKIFNHWDNYDMNVMHIEDKNGVSVPLKFKGKWKKNYCTEKKELASYNRNNKVSYLYTENYIDYQKYYLKAAGGKFLLKKDRKVKLRAKDYSF